MSEDLYDEVARLSTQTSTAMPFPKVRNLSLGLKFCMFLLNILSVSFLCDMSNLPNRGDHVFLSSTNTFVFLLKTKSEVFNKILTSYTFGQKVKINHLNLYLDSFRNCLLETLFLESHKDFLHLFMPFSSMSLSLIGSQTYDSSFLKCLPLSPNYPIVSPAIQTLSFLWDDSYCDV